ncbi:MAG: glycosyltransferase family 2 protein [Thiobacillus sp.]|nr:glycosyltransferase family 2 protein [Thiobacillus sp.]
MSEETALVLPVSMKGRVLEIVRLPKGVRGLRWDPMQCKGRLSQGPIRMYRIGFLERVVRMLVRVIPMVRSLDPMRRARHGLRWRDVLWDLQGAYRRVGELRNYLGDSVDAAAAYVAWVAKHDTLSEADRAHLRTRVGALARRPRVSVVMPTYNTEGSFLRQAIESVRGQLYDHWELCIADDASTNPEVRAILEEYQAVDPRIRVAFRAENGHISAASNTALALATGDYVALLDHDDALAEDALCHVALALADHPDAAVVYSDEDKIDAEGRRFEPHFKCDWNPDLFLSQNYVSHLGVYRRDLLERIGGFRLGVEGSQDQDLLLRCLPHVRAEQIVHVPRVLYHWRAVAGSTAMTAGEKNYTTEAGIKALRDYFAEHGPKGVAVESAAVPNTYRVRWPLPEPAPFVSLLMPTRDQKAVTEVAVRSILDRTAYTNFEIIILDNGSVEPDTLAFFDAIQREDGRVRVVRDERPFNFSALNNLGVRHARGSVIGLVNNDVEVIGPDWLGEMVSQACRPDIGCVGAKLYYGDDTLQHGGVILGIGGVANHVHKHAPATSPGYFARLLVTQNYSAVTAACLLVRREVYEAVGGLDEENLVVAFNDVDFCLKVRQAGYRNLWTPYAELYHHESVSRGTEDTPEKQARFEREIAFMQDKWGDALRADPYYNPNLSRARVDFSIAL